MSEAYPSGASVAGALLLASLLVLCAARGDADEPELVDSLAYVGLEYVERALVEEAVHLSAGEPAYPFHVTQTVRALYGLGLFDQVAARLHSAPPGHNVLTITFAERPRITELSFEGHKQFSVEDLREYAALQPGAVLCRSHLYKARLNIEQAYREEGYAQARSYTEAGAHESGKGVLVRIRIEEGRRAKVRKIGFTGNDSFGADKLRGQVKAKPSGFLRKGRYQRQKLEDDLLALEAFYHNHGYRDARVFLEEPSFQPDGEGVEIGFRIEEGPCYFFAKPAWEGVSIFDETILAGVLLFHRGDPFNQSKVDATLAGIYNMYTERGYLVQLRIEPTTVVSGDSVQVTFEVTEGDPSRIGGISILGNTRTKERVIRREITLFPGDLLRRSRLLRSQRDIFATGFFEDVAVEFNPSDEEGEVDVTFRVKERSSATANGGVGYSSQMGLTGFVKFGHNNLFGNGQSVTMELERGKKREYYNISFTEPWVFGRPISAGVDLYNTESYREVYAGQSYDAAYWQKMRGGGLRLGFPWIFDFPEYTRMSLGYSYSETRYRDYASLPQETQAQLLYGAGSRSRIFVSLRRNSTDNPFHPTLGTRATLRYEMNGGIIGGDMDYYRATFDHRQYFVPIWKPVLMLRWRLGLMGPYGAKGRMPPAERFRLGGIGGFNMLRGYDDYYIVPEENVEIRDGREYRFPGGNVLFGFTAELQFPIVDPVHGAVFLDAGDTWNSGYGMSLSGLKLGVGAGVTLEVPMLGPIGFYYAYGVERKRWRTHFAFGPQL